MLSGKWRPFCLSLNVLTHCNLVTPCIWWHKSGSTIAQVMACCLMAANHYLNQCWLIIKCVLCHSLESNSTESAKAIILYNVFENHTFEITAISPKDQRVKGIHSCQVMTFITETFSYTFDKHIYWVLFWKLTPFIMQTFYQNVMSVIGAAVLLQNHSRHQMEKFSTLLAICAGNSPVPVNSPHKGQWRGAWMFSLICVWINGWVNNHKAGVLWCYHAHYDVNVTCENILFIPISSWHRNGASCWHVT